MVKLVLPLHNYDEGGRILPPRALWWCLLFIAKSFIIFGFSLTLPEQSEHLLNMFYPKKDELYTGLILGSVAIPCALLVSFRNKIWSAHKELLFAFLKPMLIAGLIGELLFSVKLADQQYWSFSWGIAFSLVLNVLALYWAVSSKHLKLMLKDWKHRTE